MTDIYYFKVTECQHLLINSPNCAIHM